MLESVNVTWPTGVSTPTKEIQEKTQGRGGRRGGGERSTLAIQQAIDVVLLLIAGGSVDRDLQMQHESICTSVHNNANSLAETSGMAAVEMSFSRIGTPTDRAYSRPALDNANENPGLVDCAFKSAATGNGKLSNVSHFCDFVIESSFWFAMVKDSLQ